MHFVLSLADACDSERDLANVIADVVAPLSQRVARHTVKIHPISIPSDKRRATHITNELTEVERILTATVQSRVQKLLAQLSADAALVRDAASRLHTLDEASAAQRAAALTKRAALGGGVVLLAIVSALLAVAQVLAGISTALTGAGGHRVRRGRLQPRAARLDSFFLHLFFSRQVYSPGLVCGPCHRIFLLGDACEN
jgi:hypothetical protein